VPQNSRPRQSRWPEAKTRPKHATGLKGRRAICWLRCDSKREEEAGRLRLLRQMNAPEQIEEARILVNACELGILFEL
jgi:hypothetical protein